MCRLFGFRSKYNLDPHHILLTAENAILLQSYDHPDGWGIAYYKNGTPFVHKGIEPAFQDTTYQAISSAVSGHVGVVHIRRATVGNVSDLNTHPFHYGKWVFAHNGTISKFLDVKHFFEDAIDEELLPFLKGATDSEHCFFLFLSFLKKRNAIEHATALDVEVALEACMKQVATWCREKNIVHTPCMNFMITNGEILGVTKLGRDLFCSIELNNEMSFSNIDEFLKDIQGTLKGADQFLVASEKISSEYNWFEIPENSLLVADENLHVCIKREIIDLDGFEFLRYPCEPSKRPQSTCYI